MEPLELLNHIESSKFAKSVKVKHCPLTNETTATVDTKSLYDFCLWLKNGSTLKFEQLIDLCAVDYLHFGQSEWQTQSATASGFSRGVAQSACWSPMHWPAHPST